MSRYDDGYEDSNESEDADPTVRGLRTEILRLEAQLDQLTASVRERAEESARIQAKLVELEQRLGRLEARRRRDSRLILMSWAMMILSTALSVYAYLAS
jgi:septal ring factor EnvC (AmiA/AmiB activator)